MQHAADRTGQPVMERTVRCQVVAEVAQSHDGSVGQAHAFIDAAARAGADAIKFQVHLAAAESTSREPWRVKFSAQDATRYDYWRRMEFSEDEWRGLKAHADRANIKFTCSPFSTDAVEMMERVGVDAWKIASGEVTHTPLIDRMLHAGGPVWLSTGLSTLAEVDAVVRRLQQRHADIVVLQCTSEYPCPPEHVGLNVMIEYARRYRCPVGLSDHSGTIFPGIAAATLGASLVEVHLALSREMFGPDVPASLVPDELRMLVDGVTFVHSALAHPVDKTTLDAKTMEMRRIFGRSVVARTALSAGTVLQNKDLAAKKPGGGLPVDAAPDLVGRRLKRALNADDVIDRADVE